MTFQQALPIQPVEKNILCLPYSEPARYWSYDLNTGAVTVLPNHRPASYFYKVQRTASAQQMSLLAEETCEDLPLGNALRKDICRWRKANYEGATQISNDLLQYWQHCDRSLRLFFCQVEAVETVVYLNEILLGGRKPRFKSALEDLSEGNLRLGLAQALAKLQDQPADAGLTVLTRLSLKMGPGSGKTVVMSILIAWAFCNCGQVGSDERFPKAVLAVCPNLTIKERLQVLRYVHAYVEYKINFRRVDRREIGQARYLDQIVEHMLAAIRPDDEQGEPPLILLLNRYKPIATTSEVDFKTTRSVFMTTFSQINAVAAYSAAWEQSTAFRLEQSAQKDLVQFYARNDQLDFTIPCEFMDVSYHYKPDFLVRLFNDKTLALEIKGMLTEQDKAKHDAAECWISAFNNWGKLGQWMFCINRDPKMLDHGLTWLIAKLDKIT